IHTTTFRNSDKTAVKLAIYLKLIGEFSGILNSARICNHLILFLILPIFKSLKIILNLSTKKS
ncbi:unnamed protein product, partial [Rotaria sp. Silwood1]